MAGQATEEITAATCAGQDKAEGTWWPARGTDPGVWAPALCRKAALVPHGAGRALQAGVRAMAEVRGPGRVVNARRLIWKRRRTEQTRRSSGMRCIRAQDTRRQSRHGWANRPPRF